MKTTGDEVLSALGTAQFASLVAHQLQAMALRLMEAIEKRLVYVGPLAALLVVAWAITLPETPWALWRASASVGDYLVRLLQVVINSWGFWLFVGIGIVAQAAPTFVGQIWLLSSAIINLLLRAFDGFPAGLTPLLEVSVEPVPLGTWRLHHVSWAATRETFHHSTAHGAQESIDSIVDWIAQQAESR